MTVDTSPTRSDVLIGNFLLSRPLYVATLEGVQRDIVIDLRDTLQPEALRQIERYLDGKRRRATTRGE
jgi:hypothetical protein